jgi:hypothetical protein
VKKPVRFEIETPYVRIPLSFLESPAYRVLGLYERKLLDSLTAQWARDGVASNGRVVISYRDMQDAAGLRSQRLSIQAIANLALLGVIRIYKPTARKVIYTITFIETPDGRPPTHDWKQFTTDEQAKQALAIAAVAANRARTRAKAARECGLAIEDTFPKKPVH